MFDGLWKFVLSSAVCEAVTKVVCVVLFLYCVLLWM